MSIDIKIRDGEGSGTYVGVTSENALKVSNVTKSALDSTPEELTRIKLFQDFMRNNGSKDMNVNGSVTPVEFKLTSGPSKAIWITKARFILNGVNFEIDTNDAKRFGSATNNNTPLTNGILFSVSQGGLTTSAFVDPVKTTIDFLNYASSFTNIKNSISAQSDFLSIDFEFPASIALPPSATDELTITIQDDLTPIDLFQCIITGVQEVL